MATQQELLDALQSQLENPNQMPSPEEEQQDLMDEVDQTDAQGAALAMPSMKASNPVLDVISKSQNKPAPVATTSEEMPEAPSAPEAAPKLSDSQRLEEAQKHANKQAVFANLLRSFQGALQAGSRGNYKADMGVADSIESQGKAGIQGIKDQISAESSNRKEARDLEMHKVQMEDFQQKLAKSKLDFQDMQANQDPMSEQSRIAQDRVLQMQKEMGQPVNEAQIRAQNGATLFKYFPYLQQDLAKHYQVQQWEAQRLQQSKESDKRFAQDDKRLAQQDKQLAIMDAQRRDIAALNAQNKLDVAKEKAANSEESKDRVQIKKENRKTRASLDSAEGALTAQIAALKDAKKSFEDYSKSSIGGTGPLATGFGAKKYVSQGTEGLNSKFKKLSFDDLVKQFQGMSKAIDSDAERRSFEATQPSIELDDATNKQIFDDKLRAAEALLAKTKAAKQKYDREGRFTDDEPIDEKLSGSREPQGKADAPYGETVERGGKMYKWNPASRTYQLLGQ